MGNLKKSLPVLIGLAVLAVSAVGIFLLRSEPRFEGKPLSYWLKVSDTAFQGSNAVPALKAMGSSAVPILARQVVLEDSHLHKLYEKSWYMMPVVFRSFLPAPGLPLHRVMVAARALGEIGPPAVAALPNLSAALAHPEARIRRTAALAIGRIAVGASNTFRLLTHAIGDHDSQVREIASEAIAKFGTEAVPFLITEIRSTNELARLTISQAAGKADVQSLEWRGVLVERLQDTDLNVRQRAALVLAGMSGWPPKRLRTPTPGELNFLLDQAQPNVIRITLATFRTAAQPLDQSVVTKIISLTASNDESVRLEAFRTLGFCGATSESALTFLGAQLDSHDPSVLSSSISALAEIGPPAKRFLPKIEEVRMQAEPSVSRNGTVELIDYPIKRLTIEGYQRWGP